MLSSPRVCGPRAAGWNQQSNQRYANCGKRIDYLLVDAPLFTHVRSGPPLVDDETEAGAKRAATAGGRWLPAPTHGPVQGIVEASMTTHDTQFVAPHTGIIYTPPQASDHVAVSCLLDVAALGRSWDALKTVPFDATTRACTFRPQASLKAFFAPKAKRPAEGEDDGASSSAGGKRPCA